MDKLKILIADDEPDILSITAKKIMAEDYEVITAKNGQEALEKIYSQKPDIVVSDLTMPEKDGWEVLQEVRKNPPTSKWIPFIIVSARGELDDMRKGFDLEADHYITKPCPVTDILKAIRLMAKLIPSRGSNP